LCAACHLLFLASAKVSASFVPSYRSFDRGKSSRASGRCYHVRSTHGPRLALCMRVELAPARRVTHACDFGLPVDRALWDCRVVSNAHALIACIGGLRCILYDEGWTNLAAAGFGAPDNSDRHVFLSATLGYLVFDLMLCVRYGAKYGDASIVLHHSVIIVAFSLGMAKEYGTFYMCASNPSFACPSAVGTSVHSACPRRSAPVSSVPLPTDAFTGSCSARTS
jgi:hypothetical protein